MHTVPRAIRPGALIRIHAAGMCEGQVRSVAGGWIELATAAGAQFVQAAQIARIELLTAAPLDDDQDDSDRLATPRPAPMGAAAGVQAQPWIDDDIRALAHAFLDGATDSELAQRFSRSRYQITVIRHAFDAGRGERSREDCSPAAQAWIERLRRVLRPDPS